MDKKKEHLKNIERVKKEMLFLHALIIVRVMLLKQYADENIKTFQVMKLIIFIIFFLQL